MDHQNMITLEPWKGEIVTQEAGWLPQMCGTYDCDYRIFNIMRAGAIAGVVGYMASQYPGTCVAQLYIRSEHRRYWSTRRLWRTMYEIAFKHLGYQKMIAHTDNPVMAGILKREGFRMYSNGWWVMYPEWVRHRA